MLKMRKKCAVYTHVKKCTLKRPKIFVKLIILQVNDKKWSTSL